MLKGRRKLSTQVRKKWEGEEGNFHTDWIGRDQKDIKIMENLKKN